MKSSKALAVLIVAMAVGAFFVDRYEQTRPYQWQRYESPDGKFTVDFPATPVARDEPIPSGTGGTYTSHSLNTRASEHAAYGCSWWEDPSVGNRSSEDVLDRARDNGIRGVGGTLISEKKINVHGYPAREIQASARGNATFENRIVLVGTRIYSLIAVDTAGKRDSKNVERFFDSFAPH